MRTYGTLPSSLLVTPTTAHTPSQMHMDFSFAHIQCWRREGKRLKGVHLPASLFPRCTKHHLSSGEGLCISTQYLVTCVLCEQEERDETGIRCPSHPWHGHSLRARVPSDRQRHNSSLRMVQQTQYKG